MGSQAVLGLLFFSPSAATICRGTPDPTLGFPGRPAGRPGTQPGPDPGPVLRGGRAGLPPIHVRLDGPGRDSARHRAPGPGPGPGRARSRLARRGFRRQAGVAAAGLPVFGTPGSARTVLTRLGHSVAASALLGVSAVVPARALGADRGPGEGALPRRLRAALWEPCGAKRLRLRWAPAPFLCSEQCAGQGGSRPGGPSASSPAGAAGRD
jgi:hypothetical protein